VGLLNFEEQFEQGAHALVGAANAEEVRLDRVLEGHGLVAVQCCLLEPPPLAATLAVGEEKNNPFGVSAALLCASQQLFPLCSLFLKLFDECGLALDLRSQLVLLVEQRQLDGRRAGVREQLQLMRRQPVQGCRELCRGALARPRVHVGRESEGLLCSSWSRCPPDDPVPPIQVGNPERRLLVG
jgi:hypothetical protein